MIRILTRTKTRSSSIIWSSIITQCIHIALTVTEHLTKQLDLVKQHNGDGVHINFWSGLGAYADSNARGLFTHFQRSGVRHIEIQERMVSIGVSL